MGDFDRAAARAHAERYGNLPTLDALDALEAAESTIARVRDLAIKMQQLPDHVALARVILVVLDGPEETP